MQPFFPADALPPRRLWPERPFRLPELSYPARLNAARELVEPSAGLAPTRPAILTPGRIVTYGELASATGAAASGLLELGVRPGDRVLLWLPNGVEWVMAWLATLRIGAVAVAALPLLRPREVIALADDCQPAVLIATAALLRELEAFDAGSARRWHRIVCPSGPAAAATGSTENAEARRSTRLTAGAATDFDALLASPVREVPYETRRDDPAIVAYTSGSTGTPKGAVHFHEDLLAVADTFGRAVVAPRVEDVFGGSPSLAFGFGLGALLLLPFRAGAATVLLPVVSPAEVLRAIALFRISVLFAGATFYGMLLREPAWRVESVRGESAARPFTALRFCGTGGEPLPLAVFDAWRACTGLEIVEAIGTTETLHNFLSNRPGRCRPGSVGVPVPGYEVRVVSERFEAAAPGEVGRLVVRGPTGCRYWRREEQQRTYVQHGWNVTGDLFSVDATGHFYYHARADDVIVTAGYKIAPVEIERLLGEHPAVEQVAVTGLPDAERGAVVAAFVVLRPGWEPGAELAGELQQFVKQRAAPYKYPRRVEFVSSLPRTASGKLRRRGLAAGIVTSDASGLAKSPPTDSRGGGVPGRGESARRE